MKTTKLIKDWAESFGRPVNKRQGQETPAQLKSAISLVEEELKEFKEAETPEEEKKEITDLFWVVVRLAQTIGVDLDETTKAVYASNMSKLCRTHVEAKENQAEYWRGTHQHGKGKSVVTDVIEVNKKWVIRRKSDGKVMKPNNYKEAEL